ncbi:MAG: phosphatase PAP2 family protein [Arachnia sp.]
MSAVVALWVTYEFAVGTRSGQLLDTRIMDFVARSLEGVSWASTILDVISPVTSLIATACVAVFAWLHRSAAVAMAATTTVLGTMTLAVVLKEILVRPTLVDGSLNSLPSGHVAAVAGLAAGTVMAVSRPVSRVLLIVAGLVAVAVTGLATLAVEWHRPSDVVASALIAVVVAMTVALFSSARQTVREVTNPRRPLSAR